MSSKLKYPNDWLAIIRWFLGIGYLAFFSSYSTQAQPLGKLIEATLNSDSPFTIRVYGTEDGIPQHQISAITPDKTGNLLIGTANGLVEFNGQTFTDINPTDESRKILCIKMYLDRKTNILYGLNNRSHLFQITPITKDLSKEDNLSASFYHDSIIFINSNKEVRISRLGSTKSRFISRIASNNVINGVGLVGTTPFFSDSTGTYIFRQSKWTKLSKEIYYRSKSNPYSGQNYLLGYNGIAIYSNGKLIPQKFNESTEGVYFTDIAFSRHHEIFISTHKGIFYKNDQLPAF
jgi:hypothetical protein